MFTDLLAVSVIAYVFDINSLVEHKSVFRTVPNLSLQFITEMNYYVTKL